MIEQETIAPIKVVATLERRVLPACRSCGHRHPLASMVCRDPDHCPNCGADVDAPGPVLSESVDLTKPGRAYVEAKAGAPVIVDRKARLGILLIRAGNALKAFAKRIAPDD